MARKTWIRSGAVILGLAVLAVFGLGLAKATGAEGDAGGNWLASFHNGMGHHLSGQHGMHHGMGHFIQELDLSDEQNELLATIHHSLMKGLSGHGADRGAERAQLLSSIENGTLSAGEVERMLDDHLAVMRSVGSEVAQPLSALINSFDDEQRAKMIDHLKALHGGDS